MRFVVKTRDVDGPGRSHIYKHEANARKRFAEMSGYDVDEYLAVLYDNYPESNTFEKRGFCSAVSDFGCVVTIRREP